jgi:phosphopantothenoylcysteine decarboxylase / phosphopantothenate---cysteine ligase
MAAAVADFRPRNPAAHKLKKNSAGMTLDLAAITDELPRLAGKKASRILIGFAAETQDLEVNALDKLRRKKLDLIVGNDVSRADAGFGVDTNIVTMLSTDGRVETTPKLMKDAVADVILDRLVAIRAARTKSASISASR